MEHFSDDDIPIMKWIRFIIQAIIGISFGLAWPKKVKPKQERDHLNDKKRKL